MAVGVFATTGGTKISGSGAQAENKSEMRTNRKKIRRIDYILEELLLAGIVAYSIKNGVRKRCFRTPLAVHTNPGLFFFQG
jgi:hypothetical protein